MYPALEGTDAFIVIDLIRDLSIYTGEVILEYATTDLSGVGVDALKFAECLTLPTGIRSAALCGHYQQTSGLVRIPPGTTSGVFTVNIMNDLCRQKFFRYVQITLSVPGSASLQSEALSAKIRIDDDDFLLAACQTQVKGP